MALMGMKLPFLGFSQFFLSKVPGLCFKIYSNDYLVSTNDNSPIYSDLSAHNANYLNHLIFIRVKFTDPIFGDFSVQAFELNHIINKINLSLGTYASSYEIILLGHSKGGLVNMYYSMFYSSLKLISINTPYSGPTFVTYSLWQTVDINITTQILNTVTAWNSTIIHPRLICIATNKDNQLNDDVVPTNSGLGLACAEFVIH